MNQRRGLSAAVSLLTALTLQVPAAVSIQAKVQAGGPVSNTRGQVYCSFNFVFTDGSSSYIGTADHCFDDTMYPGAKGLRVGDTVRTGDVNDVAGRLTSATEIGKVVVSDGEIDFALVKINPGVEVVARVRGWGGPSGVAHHSDTTTGDIVLATGYGLGIGELSATRSRSGILVSDDARWQSADLLATPGDSGGPIMTRSGKALGVITTLGQSSGTLEHGPTVAYILERMASSGYHLSLVTYGSTSIAPSPNY